MKPLVMDKVVKSFGRLQILGGVSMSLEEGERRVILGPNGAGKTTLFHSISGVHDLTGGTVSIYGHDVSRMPVHKRVALGLGRTFQITNLFPDMTVFETIFLGVQAQVAGKYVFWKPATVCKSVVATVEGIIEEWGLAPVRDDKVRHLSYGQQRQLEVILAMAAKPRILLLDEPTAGLSPAETASMTEFLKGLTREITILMIEHDMDVAFNVADSISVMYFGNILVEGTPEAVQKDSRVMDIYLGETKWEPMVG